MVEYSAVGQSQWMEGSSSLGAGIVTVGEWRLDVAARSMTNGSVDRSLSPRALRVLLVLAEAEGDVVQRGTLLDRVWPDVVVTDESLTQAIAELRRAFGPRRGDVGPIQTISKSGYRLTVPVTFGMEEADLPFTPDNNGFDLRSYELCLEARRVLAQGGAHAVELSEALAREAVEVAPKFALAQAEFSIALAQRCLYRSGDLDSLKEAVSRAETAIRLRPDLALAQSAYGFALGAVERWAEATIAFESALSLDQNDSNTHYLAARTQFAGRNYRSASILAERAAALAPDDYRALYLGTRACAAFDQGRAKRLGEACLQRIQSRLATDPDEARALNALAPLLAQLGMRDSAIAALNADAERCAPVEFYNAVALAVVGDETGAVDALETVADRGWRHAAWLSAEPGFQRVAQTARFQRLASRLQ